MCAWASHSECPYTCQHTGEQALAWLCPGQSFLKGLIPEKPPKTALQFLAPSLRNWEEPGKATGPFSHSQSSAVPRGGALELQGTVMVTLRRGSKRLIAPPEEATPVTQMRKDKVILGARSWLLALGCSLLEALVPKFGGTKFGS